MESIPLGSKFSLSLFCSDVQSSRGEKSIREDETQKAISAPAGAGNRAECNSATRQFENESILGKEEITKADGTGRENEPTEKVNYISSPN